MYLGIDIGTSSVKSVLVDDHQAVVATVSSGLKVSRPQPLWSEQAPRDWWGATLETLDRLHADHGTEMSGVRGIGLSGQMHGATLLDARDRVLRPAILWNDGRSAAECRVLESRQPRSRQITGNLAMPGFTAPKLLWVARHEPRIFARVARVLLPKDYVRWCLCGEYCSDLSDASGTLWLDVAARAWSEEMLAATDLDISQMPALVEGSEATGDLRRELAARWGMSGPVTIAGGAGDNAAGAVGIGAVEPGSAFLSLGTSGVYFVANRQFTPNPEQAVHAFCHCLPDRWHQMSVILSAASCLDWVRRLTGAVDEATLLGEVASLGLVPGSRRLLFLPYLSGERTPHNDPDAQGVFFGLGHDSDRAMLARAVLEGVAFAFADGQDALLSAGTSIDSVAVIGGGSRSRLWGRILASVLNRPLHYHAGGDTGPAFGASRLARLALSNETIAAVCTAPPVVAVVEPEAELRDHYRQERRRFRKLYQSLKPEFAPSTPT